MFRGQGTSGEQARGCGDHHSDSHGDDHGQEDGRHHGDQEQRADRAHVPVTVEPEVKMDNTDHEEEHGGAGSQGAVLRESVLIPGSRAAGRRPGRDRCGSNTATASSGCGSADMVCSFGRWSPHPATIGDESSWEEAVEGDRYRTFLADTWSGYEGR